MTAAFAPVSFTASATVLKTGTPSTFLAGLSRRHPGDDVGAVVDGAFGVKLTFVAR